MERYKFITSLPAKNCSFSPLGRKLTDIKFIVVHYTGNYSDTAYNNARYFNLYNNDKVGAHFFIDDHNVYQSIAPTKVAYAVGKKYGKAPLWGKVTNRNSLSVELCSTNGFPSEDTLAQAELFIKGLMYKYHIPVERVVRHFDVSGKKCPGWVGWSGDDSKDWFRFKARFYSQ